MTYDNDQVRRQDRLLDESSAMDLLRRAEWGVLSMRDADGAPYGVPVNYVWDGNHSIYIHCAPEGRKLRCLDQDARVSFCVVGQVQWLVISLHSAVIVQDTVFLVMSGVVLSISNSLLQIKLSGVLLEILWF